MQSKVEKYPATISDGRKDVAVYANRIDLMNLVDGKSVGNWVEGEDGFIKILLARYQIADRCDINSRLNFRKGRMHMAHM